MVMAAMVSLKVELVKRKEKREKNGFCGGDFYSVTVPERVVAYLGKSRRGFVSGRGQNAYASAPIGCVRQLMSPDWQKRPLAVWGSIYAGNWPMRARNWHLCRYFYLPCTSAQIHQYAI